MRKLVPLLLGLLVGAALVPTAQAQMRYSVAPYSNIPYPYRADPAVNNYLSAIYDRRLQIDMRFRAYRKWKECHRITWPGLRPACIASFDQYEPIGAPLPPPAP